MLALLLTGGTGPGSPPAGDTPARIEDLREEKPDSNLVITLTKQFYLAAQAKPFYFQ